MVRIWEKSLRSNPGLKALPPILPIVLAQSDKPWQSPTRFLDLLAIPRGLEEDLLKVTPDFRFQLVELFRMPFEKIVGTPMGVL